MTKSRPFVSNTLAVFALMTALLIVRELCKSGCRARPLARKWPGDTDDERFMFSHVVTSFAHSECISSLFPSMSSITFERTLRHLLKEMQLRDSASFCLILLLTHTHTQMFYRC